VPLADALLDHAIRLLANTERTDADYRRSVSASYYATFHLISAAVAAQACPPVPTGLRGKWQRTLDHRAMKNGMAYFLTPESIRKFSADTVLPCNFSHDLSEIAKAFGDLQEARNLADYDILDSEGTVHILWASDCLEKAKRIFEAWHRTQETDEAKLFLACLIPGTKWAR
jgi:hypothetical protein